MTGFGGGAIVREGYESRKGSRRGRDVYSTPFPLVDVAAILEDKILTHNRIAPLELVRKHIWQRDLLELLAPLAHLPQIVNSATDEPLESLVNHMLQTGNTADPRGFTERLVELSPDEHKEKMMTIAEQLKQIGREEGLEKGLERGLERGREEGQERGRKEERLAIARNLFDLGLPFEKIMLVTGLSEAEIRSLRPH
jgi:predicted transposase/invertase (TIGR01784 family)